MKKILFYAIIPTFLLLSTRLYAQPDWQWGKRLGNSVEDIAVDNHGNTYVIWSLGGTQAIEGHVFTSHGGADIGLTSFSCDGAYRWTKVIGGLSADVGLTVGTDTLGGVYMTMGLTHNSNSVDISGDTTITESHKRYFIVKYNSLGVYQWLRTARTDTITGPNLENSGAFELFVTPGGNLYIPSALEPGIYGDGAYTNTFPFDPMTTSGSGIHILKYDRFGNCLGGIHFDLYHSGTIPRGYARDPNTGRYYLCGFVPGFTPDTLIFGETMISGGVGTYIGYIAAYDSTGNFLWVNQSEPGEGSFFRYDGKPCLDDEGNIYCAGTTHNGQGVGDITFTNSLGPDVFPILVKLNPEGEVINATNASTNSATNGKAVAYTNNTIAVSGGYPEKIIWGDVSAHNTEAWRNVFLVRFNPDSITSPISLDTLISSPGSQNFVTDLISDPEGNFYLTGEFPGSLYIGPDIIYNQNSHDGFIAKFGTDSCLCTPPTALFSYDSLPADYTYAFNYTGTSPIDSLIWDFGDGQTGGESNNTTHTFIPDSTYTVCVTAYNPCGVHTFCDTVHVEIMVGIDPINNFEGVTVYPNPTKDKLNIAHAPPGTVVNIYTILGTRVLQKRMTGGKNQIDVSGLTPGLYLMRFTDGKGKRGFTRFVKG